MCTKGAVYLLLNVYSFCNYGNFKCLLNYKAHLAELADICNNENFHETIIIGDLNADPSKRRFSEIYLNLLMSKIFLSVMWPVVLPTCTLIYG